MTSSWSLILQLWGTIFDICSHIMAYGDDVVIMGSRLQDIEEVFTSLVEQTNKMVLEVNGERGRKAKFMTV